MSGGGMNQQMSIFSNETNPTGQNSLFSKNGDPFNYIGAEYQFTMKPTGTQAAPSLGANSTP